MLSWIFQKFFKILYFSEKLLLKDIKVIVKVDVGVTI